MLPPKFTSVLALCLLPLSALFADIRIEGSPVNHLAKVGDTLTYTVSGGANDPQTLSAVLVANNANVQTLSLVLPPGDKRQVVYTTSAQAPGVLTFAVEKPNGKGFGRNFMNGAFFATAISPEQVKPSGKPAADLLAYWDAFKEKLSKIPATPAYKLVETKDGVELYEFSIDAGIGAIGSAAGVKAIGYMAKPVGNGPFPAVVTFYGAGSFEASAQDAVYWARKGAFSWSLNPHPLPNDWTKEQREAAKAGVLKDYNQRGKNTAREDVYFNGMFARDYQVIQAIRQSPWWNKKQLVVRGFSQGGAQSIATAFLCPEVTALAPQCPALLEVTGALAGRKSCWPYWVQSPADQKEIEMTGTFDLVNAAPHMKAKLLIAAGLLDGTCPPAGQMAFYNLYEGPKDIIYMPTTSHGKDKNWIETEEAFVLGQSGLAGK